MTQNKISSNTYIRAVSETIILFTLSSFCLAVFFRHEGYKYLFLSILMVVIFLFVTVASIYRLVQRSSLASIMLMIPIAPLLILIMFIVLMLLL